jgi:cytochrome c oxidase subunit 2
MMNGLPSRVAALLCLAVLAVSTMGCMQGSAAAPPSGASLYGSCSSCHGVTGEGNVAFDAPSIAGLPQWYVASQLQRFQTGLRGKHADDVEGLKMRAMARQMMTDAETTAVASYVSGLPAVKNAATLTDASASTGQAMFALCMACHGAKGEGNEAVKAPPLAGQDDWYVAAQLRKFRAGIRGTVPGDTVGPIMQAMSLTIPPENINHLAAYAASLPR